MRPSKAIEIVARVTEVEPELITGQSQHGDVVEARRLVMFLWSAEWGFSSTIIGRRLGGRDHATVLSGLKRHRALSETDRRYREKHEEVMAEYEKERS